MSDVRRLLDDPNASDETRELLSTLEPPSRLSEPMRAVIGVRLSSSVTAPAAAAKLATLKLAGLIGAVVAGGAAVVSFAVRAPSNEAPVRPVPGLAAPKPNVVAPPAPAAATPEPERAAEVKPVAAPTRSAARRDTLLLEESLLEKARSSIDSPALALSILREHELKFPNGELTAERLFLTAQAYARAGNETAARHYAKLLATRFPKSTYLPRVRSLLGPPPGEAAR
jgi:hypothetical protein